MGGKPLISREKIEEINERVDILRLVGNYVSLTKQGKNYFGLCPFHDDKSPSFSVNPEKKIAKCMSCGEGGKPISFLQKIENISFPEACQKLAQEYGIPLDITIADKKDAIHEKFYKMNQIAQEFYTHYLFSSQSGQEALTYLYNRGLTDETIRLFKIGLAPKNKDTIYRVLKDQGYEEIDMEDVGLIKMGKQGYYDLFSNRIMFPISNVNKQIIGFSGRVYLPQDAEQPKYVNTPETPIFVKGEHLYNLNNALSDIRKRKRVILCEGQMDAIAIANSQIGEVVCSLGTALTIEQVQLLKRYTPNILICYDADDAGQKATSRAIETIQELLTVQVVTLPDKLDPDEYIKKFGTESFAEYLEKQAKDKYEFLYEFAFRNRRIKNANDYEQVKKNVFQLLSTIKSATLVERFQRRLAEDLAVSYEAVKNDYQLKRERKQTFFLEESPETKAETPIKPKYLKAERMLLAYLTYSLEYAKRINHLSQHNLMEYLVQDDDILALVEINSFLTRNILDMRLMNEINKKFPKVYDDIYQYHSIIEETPVETHLEEIAKCFDTLLEAKFEQQFYELDEKILQAPTNEEKIQLANEKIRLKKNKQKERRS